MLTLDILRREKKAEILHRAEIHGCHNVRVFGSVATGENRPDSDVDFLVDLDGGIHPYIRARVLAEAVPLSVYPPRTRSISLSSVRRR